MRRILCHAVVEQLPAYLRFTARMATSMDYDSTDIPAGYDRAREHGPEMLELWMNHVGRYLRQSRQPTILDLGCGTGRFADALATHFDATVIGLDPSRKM